MSRAVVDIRVAKRLAGIALAGTLLLVASACSTDVTSEASAISDAIDVTTSAAPVYVDSNGYDIAATVNDRVITRAEVYARIKMIRAQNGLANDADYLGYLGDLGISQSDYFSRVLDIMVDETLVEMEAERLGITVSERDVDTRIAQLSSRYPNRSSWLETLTACGYTEASYREAVHSSMISSAVENEIVSQIEPSRNQLAEYAEQVAPALEGRRSSHILFSQNDLALAQDVLAQLQAGADFDQMASQYSLDGSGADGGDMGWDSVNPLPDEYQEALDQLEPGEISGIVSSQFGYHIILCTERYVPTYHEDGSLDLEAIPPSLFDYIREQMRLTSGLLAYQAYMQTLESDADIVIYD